MGFTKDIKSKDFIAAFVRLQEDYSVTDLKMSDYDINLDEFLILTTDIRSMQMESFLLNFRKFNDEDCAEVFENAFR